MLSELFVSVARAGAEWVLVLLILISVLSISLIIERAMFFRKAKYAHVEIRKELQSALQAGNINKAYELTDDLVIKVRKAWEKNLPVLATIGSNAPFVGLFGTVLGIIQAFQNLALHASVHGEGAGTSAVTAGLSEALVATGVGIFVAIPAVVAFNLFQARVKSAVAEAESIQNMVLTRKSHSHGNA